MPRLDLTNLPVSADVLALNPHLRDTATRKAPKPSKYGNEPTIVDGIRFDSRAEARRYGELKLLVAAGLISDLELQPRFTVSGGKRPIIYIADFAYVENGKRVVEDVKGVQTKEFRLKKKLFEAVYPELELRIVEV